MNPSGSVEDLKNYIYGFYVLWILAYFTKTMKENM